MTNNNQDTVVITYITIKQTIDRGGHASCH